ncbi:MAG: hypothetical protein RL204_2081, partial [Bacteroidota bacterium]
MDSFSFLSNTDTNSIDSLYNQYKKDPSSVDISWARFFEGFDFQKSEYAVLPGGDAISGAGAEALQKEFKVINLINGYRQRGHLFTKTNPVRERRKYSPSLDIENFGLSAADLETTFHAGTEVGLGDAKLKDIIAHLDNSYCQSIGVEYQYIRDPERVSWLREKIEAVKKPVFSAEEKKAIFEMSSRASLFEQYIHKKFVGQKRFSIEGCEALVPAMDYVVRKGAEKGVKEYVIGMAHRGRLNVLSNILDKPQEQIFQEFEGVAYEDENFDGDVKYHLGFSRDIEVEGKQVHITLCPNPSHLEAVNPVVEGLARAKVDHYLNDYHAIVPILVHGDAAVAGQGIVYEVVQMAGLDGYKTGGTIHIVTNNQVGFTTNYLDARTSIYCTDVAKTTLCPIFHVNADDIEAVIRVMDIALEYRQRYQMDVFVDLLGYRKYGHNEGDEPKFTQPTLYKLIASHPSLREIYMNRLIAEGTIDQAYADQVKKAFEDHLEGCFEKSKASSQTYVKHFLEETWKGIRKATDKDFEVSPNTGVDKKKLTEIAKKITTLPAGEKYFKKTEKVFE